jgi:DNA excision repair protein ERCC-2
MTRVTVSVRDFALPVPRVGSIELNSGYGRMPVDGQEIHLNIQRRNAKADPKYQAEVKIEAEFERDGYLFVIGGRVDGLFAADPPRIEEIKSTFNTHELEKKLRKSPHHPYCLQLKTYGYFYYLEHKILPKLNFHLVSSRSFAAEDLPIALDIDEYESWFERRMGELVEETRRSEARSKRRRKIAAAFPFPFEQPRPGQVELIESIEDGMKERIRMLIQAPTGLGKTAGVLYPTLREAMTRGQGVLYVTPKSSQHSVAEDAVERFQDTGSKVRSLTITAKAKICFKNEPLCNPDYCEFAKDYYTKVHAAGLQDLLAKKKKLTSRVFRTIGEQYEVCPFELQLEAAKDVEVVIGDYNYAFGPRTAFSKLTDPSPGQEGHPNLVIDEAHNLYSRAMGYYSPEVSSYSLERMRKDVQALPPRFRADAEMLLDQCIATVAACRPEGVKQSMVIEAPADLFLAQDTDLRAFLSRYLESDVEIQPRDVVLRLCFYWSEFTAALDYVAHPKRPEFFTTYRAFGAGGTVKITCCDASEMLKACYDEYDQVVGFSATLKPFDYYAKLSGLEPDKIKTAEFQSPFPKRRRKLLIIPEISTKYSERERNYGKIAEAISRIAALKVGNYFAFFPSFEFMERTLERFMPPDGFTVIQQTREMKADDIQAVVDHLRGQVAPALVFAVQGGVFSEGVDYPGETIIGAFVVGPPLPNFDLEREKMREYYQTHYGAGFDYAYSYPAMSKAVQAAGRVVRSETDRGLIVLMDNRFMTPNYSQSMPTDWFERSPAELVSRQILKEVSEFWTDTEEA